MPDDFEFDVFLSYSIQDKPTVHQLAERLRADGLRVWYDEWSIAPGESIPSAVDRGLEGARVLLFCMSASSLGADWPTHELQTAVFRDPSGKQRRFLPVRLDDAEPRDSIRRFLALDWRDRSPAAYRRLLEAVRPGSCQPKPSSRDVYVKLSLALSVDGQIDDASEHKLVLSTPNDWDQVDRIREWADAILVGAETMRRDRPRLLIRNDHRQAARLEAGRQANPTKVTITSTGNLDPDSPFFLLGEAPKLVFCSTAAEGSLRKALGSRAEVVGLQHPIRARDVLERLAARGLFRLMVEGGAKVATMFLSEGLVDELRLAVAPFFIAEEGAPRLVLDRTLPHTKPNPMELTGLERIDGMAILQYRLKRSD